MPMDNDPTNPEGPQPGNGGDSGGGNGDLWGALINFAGMLVNNNQQETMAEHQNQWEKDAAAQANQWNMDQWNRQNAYNSPEAQMARWKAAGLNPNLIYGGSSSGGNAMSSPRAERPGSMVPVPTTLSGLPDVISNFQDLELRHAQIDNVKAQTDNVRSRTINESMMTGLNRIRTGRDTLKLENEKEFSHEVSYYNTQKLRKLVRNEGMKWNLMDEQSQINALVMDQRRKNLTATDLENEKRQADIEFKRNENEWRRVGVTSGDNVMLRMLVRLMNSELLNIQ